MRRTNDFLIFVCKWLIIVMMPFMIGLMFIQVLLRYLFNCPLTWAGEMGRYLLIWISSLGSAYGLRYGMHIGINFLSKSFKGYTRSLLLLISHLLIISFCGVCFIEGLIFSFAQRTQLAPALEISMSWALVSIPVGFGMTILFDLEVAAKDVQDMIRNLRDAASRIRGETE